MWLRGGGAIDGTEIPETQMAVLTPGSMPTVTASADSRMMLCGGKPIDGKRTVWWNFVASDKALMDQAKADWKAGKFAKVPGDDEFIPLPED